MSAPGGVEAMSSWPVVDTMAAVTLALSVLLPWNLAWSSRVSPVCASADEMVREVRSLTGVPSSSPNPCIAGLGAAGSLVAAGCCGVVDRELVGADCEMAVENQRHTISDAVPILFSMLNFPSGGDSLGKRNSEGKESGKALIANTGIIREAKQMSMTNRTLR